MPIIKQINNLVKCYKKRDRQVLAGKVRSAHLEELTLPDKSNLQISMTKIPLHDRLGQCYGLVGIARDVTYQKRIEKLLKVYQARFKNLP